MRTSKGLPTAVDFNNILVNYIEIGLEDIPKSRRESALKQPPLPVSPSNEDQIDPISGTATPGDRGEGDSSDYSELEKEELPEGDFRRLIPQALVDLDSVPEDDPRYKRAAQVLTDIPAPPSLPMFLSRSILNGNLPVKDDSSVLALPNHTVLNHLMTSSVRNGVLATSVTCRYKKKVSASRRRSEGYTDISVVCNYYIVQAGAEESRVDRCTVNPDKSTLHEVAECIGV